MYLGNPSGQLKREKIYYDSYSGGVFSDLKRGVETNNYLPLPTAWGDDTIVEIVGSVTIANAPAKDSDVFVEYKYSGDAVDRSRSNTINYELPTINFLDQSDDLSTGWKIDTLTSGISGSGQIVTDVAGQTALIKLRGTEISAVLSESIGSGGTSLFVIDEGTANEISLAVDSSKSDNVQEIKSLATSLTNNLHTLRIVNLENKKLAIDTIQANGSAPILKKAASSEIIYEEPVADLNPITAGEGKTNDVFYWNTTDDIDERGSLLLKGTITANETTITIDSGTGSDLNLLARPSGVIQINAEKIKYGNFVQSGSEVTLLNLTRGYDSTDSSGHNDNAEIYPKGAWRNNLNAQNTSWYKQLSTFPEEVKVVAMDTGLSLLDSSDNSLWMHFSEGSDTLFGENTNNKPSSVVMRNGVIWTGFSGT